MGVAFNDTKLSEWAGRCHGKHKRTRMGKLSSDQTESACNLQLELIMQNRLLMERNIYTLQNNTDYESYTNSGVDLLQINRQHFASVVFVFHRS